MHRVAFLFASAVALAAGAARAADEVVLTDSGAPLKVVVRNETAVYESPDLASSNSPARVFDFYYVLPPESGKSMRVGLQNTVAAQRSGFYRVSSSDREKDVMGWIPAKDVVEWPHRQALGLRPVVGRQPAEFFKEKRELQSVMVDKKTIPPLSRETPGGSGLRLMPLLEESKIRGASGDEWISYRVAYLHSQGGKAGTPTGGRVDLGKSSLDVVFVIDTTASMTPSIEGTKEVVAQLARRLAEDKANTVPVRLGLVAYRDTADYGGGPGWYVSKVFWELSRGSGLEAGTPAGTDLAAFLQVLNTELVAEGGEETAEDVLAGLKSAIQMPGWNPNGFKHLILIGDASGHVTSDDPKNSTKLSIEAIKAMMQPPGPENLASNICCHAIRILSEDRGDHARCEEQFAQLAEGVSFPGAYDVFNVDDGPKFVDTLSEIINKSRAGLGGVVPSAGGTAGPPAADTPGLGLLLELVAASAPGDGDQPTFASGFACRTDRDGNEQLEPYLLVQLGQLETFRALLNLNLNVAKQAGDPGSKDVEKIVQDLQNACTQLSMAEPVTEDLPLSKIFELLLGFPVKNDVFKVTPRVLAEMTQEDFDRWVAGVETCDTVLRGYIENPKLWFALGRNDRPQSRHGFLKISELP